MLVSKTSPQISTWEDLIECMCKNVLYDGAYKHRKRSTMIVPAADAALAVAYSPAQGKNVHEHQKFQFHVAVLC